MDNEKLRKILHKHGQWLRSEEGGVCADLTNANLRYANLSYADLSYADFENANLKYADLRDVDLSGAELRGVDLEGANLSGAELRGVDLTNTKLNWANLEQVKGLDVIIVQINISKQNRQIKYIPSLNKVFVGCFSGTLDELKEKVKETRKYNSKIKERYLKAISFIEEIVKDY